MSSDELVGRFLIGDLIKAGVISAHKDGNFGSLYPRIEDFGDDGFPLLTAKVVNGGRIDFGAAQKLRKEKAARLPYGFIQAGDVLLSHNATVGRVAVVPEFNGQALIGTSLTYFRLDTSRLLPRYLAGFFESRDFQNQLASVMGLSTRNQVPITAQRLLEVEVPPLKTQHRISEFIGAIDDRITLLRETNATLEAIAQALFKSWFVDFDPVRAKQQGLVPAGMDEVTATLFPDSFEDSALGLVPKGWRGGTLDDLSDLNSQSWSGRHHPERVRYLDLANVKDNEIATVTEFAFYEAPSRARRVLRSGDTIVGTVRPGNRSFAYIHEPVPGLTASTGFAVLSPKVVDNTAFVYLAATQDASIEHLSHVADGGAYPAVRPDVVSALACVVPSAEILRTFNGVTCPLLVKVSANQQQAEVLVALRDTLLPRLISGQLRLLEVASEATEAVT